MKYLLLSLSMVIAAGFFEPVNSSMTCKQVKEVAETVLDAPGLTTDQKYFILEGLFGGHYEGCSDFTEDAND